MVRKLVLTLFLAAVAWSAAAQRPRTRLEWGVIGGINVPDYTTNMSKAEVKNKLGWQVGITTAVNLGVVAVEPQILYVRQGLRIRPAGIAEVNVKSKSIDVPVLVSLRLLNPFRIYAGPVSTGLPSGPTRMALAPEERINSSNSAPQLSGEVSASRSTRRPTCSVRSRLTTAV